jgi:hypothetical protein
MNEWSAQQKRKYETEIENVLRWYEHVRRLVFDFMDFDHTIYHDTTTYDSRRLRLRTKPGFLRHRCIDSGAYEK